jgi:hypothetical protein
MIVNMNTIFFSQPLYIKSKFPKAIPVYINVKVEFYFEKRREFHGKRQNTLADLLGGNSVFEVGC